MLLCLTQTFPIPHPHISPHPLNRKGYQRPWSNRNLLINVPEVIYSSLSKGHKKVGHSRGLAGSGCPLGSIPCCRGLAFFSREFLVFWMWENRYILLQGVLVWKMCWLCDDLVSSGLNIFFMLDLVQGILPDRFCHCQIQHWCTMLSLDGVSHILCLLIIWKLLSVFLAYCFTKMSLFSFCTPRAIKKVWCKRM